MDAGTERHASELRRARSATFWKTVVTAGAAFALSVVVITSLQDRRRRYARDDDRESRRIATLEARGAASVSTETTPLGDTSDFSARSAAPRPSETAAFAEPMAPTTTPAPASFVVVVVAAPTPTLAMPATPLRTLGDPAAASGAAEKTTADRRAAPVAEAEANVAVERPNPWAPPPMSAGAGPFITEAPYWGASAFVSDPDTGAGRFLTDAPPWAASAFTSNPNAGAGPFTTERTLPAYGLWPLYVLSPYR